jgi:hypothetical protein
MSSVDEYVFLCMFKNSVNEPETMLQAVLEQVHYQPNTWQHRAHEDNVRAEFGQMFQLKYVSHLSYMLDVYVVNRSVRFNFSKNCSVRWLRRWYSVCIFAGNRCRSLTFFVSIRSMCLRLVMCVVWHNSIRFNMTRDTYVQLSIRYSTHVFLFTIDPMSFTFQCCTQGQLTFGNDLAIDHDGKLELSLIHFHHTNPQWHMNNACEHYFKTLQERGNQEENSLFVDKSLSYGFYCWIH